MKNFFERIKEERKRLGLTQEEMAKAGGVRKQAQSLYESGKRFPDASYLIGISIIGADVTYILTEKRADQLDLKELSALQLRYGEADEKVKGAFDALSALPDDELLALLPLLKSLQAKYSEQDNK